MINEYFDGEVLLDGGLHAAIKMKTGFPLKENCFRAVYRCACCNEFERFFYIKADNNKGFYMKVGQFPSWEIKGDKNIERRLGKYSDYYEKGLVCESQGYGVASFAYYRRIVERIIDQLLKEIPGLLSGEDLEQYRNALLKVNETIVAQEKIALVKDLLPPILKPDNINPLAILYSALSEGLHAESDEECLQHAAECRTALVFLVHQITDSNTKSKEFTDSMRKLLDKKSR